MIRKAIILAAFVALTGCNRPVAKEAHATAPNIGRWKIVPASSMPYNGGQRTQLPIYAAWRINTETGAIEFCTYDAGTVLPDRGSHLPTVVKGPELKCSVPLAAQAH